MPLFSAGGAFRGNTANGTEAHLQGLDFSTPSSSPITTFFIPNIFCTAPTASQKSDITVRSRSRSNTAIMGYPDTFEGFMVEDQKKWSDFKKQEVRDA